MGFHGRSKRRNRAIHNVSFLDACLEQRTLLSGTSSPLLTLPFASGMPATSNSTISQSSYAGFIGPIYSYPYQYPQDENITASVTVTPAGGQLLFERIMIFRGTAVDSQLALHEHENTVPFKIEVNSTGPINLIITRDNGQIYRTSSPGGTFTFWHYESTEGKEAGDPVSVRARVETQRGKGLAIGEGVDTVAVENLKIADELIRLKPKALELIAEQSKEQSQQLIDSIFTEESILEHAQQQHALNPDGPTVGQIIEQINETQLPAMKEQLEELFSNTAEKSLDLLLKGDMQIYQFKAAATDKRFPEFVKGIREMRNGIDISSTRFEFGYGVMPDVKSFKNWNQPSDFIHLFDKLQPTASISAPIKYDGLVAGSVGANLSGVSFEDWTTRPLDQIEKLDLSISSSIGYKRSWDIDRMIFDSRFRANFELGIQGKVQMSPIQDGEAVRRFWNTRDATLGFEGILSP